MTRYTVKDVAGAHGGVVSTFELRCSTAAVGTPVGAMASVASGASGAETHFAWADDQAHNSVTWPTGGWGASVEVTEAGADLTYALNLSRSNAAGTALRTLQFTDVALLLGTQSGTGIKSVTNVTVTDINNDAGRADTDRVCWRIRCSNSNMMNAQTLTVNVEDADTWIEGTNLTPPSSGQNINVGLVTEADTAQSFTKVDPIHRAVAQTTTADTAQVVGKSKARATGLVTESGTAQPVGVRKAVAVGPVTETATTQVVARSKALAFGQVSTTDLAQVITVTQGSGPQNIPVGLVTEADIAQVLAKSKALATGLVIEASTPQMVTPRRSYAVGLAVETDLAQAAVTRKATAVAQVTAAHAALSVSVAKAMSVSVASETDTSQPTVGQKGVTVSQATETGIAQTATHRKAKTLGQATEADLAQGVTTGAALVNLNPALETDSAQALSARKTRLTGLPLETGITQMIAVRKSRTLTLALETNETQILTWTKRKAISLASELASAPSFTVRIQMWRFEPPTYQKMIAPTPLVRRPRVALTEAISVVRINGTLQSFKTPSVQMLQAAGEEGRDWFRGGGVYEVSKSVSDELVAAGYSTTEI